MRSITVDTPQYKMSMLDAVVLAGNTRIVHAVK